MSGMGGEMRCKMCGGMLRYRRCEQCDPAGYQSVKADFCDECGADDHNALTCYITEYKQRIADLEARVAAVRDYARGLKMLKELAQRKDKRVTHAVEHQWKIGVGLLAILDKEAKA